MGTLTIRNSLYKSHGSTRRGRCWGAGRRAGRGKADREEGGKWLAGRRRASVSSRGCCVVWRPYCAACVELYITVFRVDFPVRCVVSGAELAQGLQDGHGGTSETRTSVLLCCEGTGKV